MGTTITTATAMTNVDDKALCASAQQFHIALCNNNDNNNAAATTYVVNNPLVNILLCCIKAMTNNKVQYCAQAYDTITSRCAMATTTRPRLQQQPLLSTSPSCAGAQALFCNTLQCTMSTATKQQW
jgi:hypothetical protein